MIETRCHWHWKDRETGTISFVRKNSPACPYCCCPDHRSCGHSRRFHRACDFLPTSRGHLAESGGEEGDCRYRHHRQGATRLRCYCRHHWLGRTCRQCTKGGKVSITADLPQHRASAADFETSAGGFARRRYNGAGSGEMARKSKMSRLAKHYFQKLVASDFKDDAMARCMHAPCIAPSPSCHAAMPAAVLISSFQFRFPSGVSCCLATSWLVHHDCGVRR